MTYRDYAMLFVGMGIAHLLDWTWPFQGRYAGLVFGSPLALCGLGNYLRRLGDDRRAIDPRCHPGALFFRHHVPARDRQRSRLRRHAINGLANREGTLSARLDR